MRRWNLRGMMLKLHLLLVIAATDSLCSSTVSAGTQLEDLAIRAGFRIVASGDSTGESQKQAAAQLPVRSMTPANRQRTLKVLEKCSQFRRLPELQYAVDPAMYRYLLHNPDVAVSTWRVMGISQFEMWQTGPLEYEARATDGSEGLADILYRDDQQCVFICDGRYQNPMLPRPLEAVALIWFRYAFLQGTDGSCFVSQKADVFVSFTQTGLSAVAKLLTPVTNSLMDRNLYEVSLYASLMSRAVRDEPEWVIQVAQQMDGVLPQRSNELIGIARQPRMAAIWYPNGSRNPREERQRLISSGLSPFAPPTQMGLKLNEELAAVPKAPAPTVPQVAANAATQSAAGSSTTSPPAGSVTPRLQFISRNNSSTTPPAGSTAHAAGHPSRGIPNRTTPANSPANGPRAISSAVITQSGTGSATPGTRAPGSGASRIRATDGTAASPGLPASNKQPQALSGPSVIDEVPTEFALQPSNLPPVTSVKEKTPPGSPSTNVDPIRDSGI